MSLLSAQLRNRRPLITILAVILLLRGSILSLPTRIKLRGKQLSPQELLDALQQLYEVQPDGTKFVLVPYRGRLSKVPIHPTPPEKFASDASHFPPISATVKPNIDSVFLRQLKAILFRVAIPSWRTKEALIVVLHSFFLIMRTVLSIAVARLDGRIVRDLVRADAKGFLKGLGLWFLLAIPSTYTNSMIRHLQSKLALRLRTRLTRYTHDLYLSSAPDLKYYRTGLEGVDQYITADVESWSQALAGLYGNILKPTLDLLLFTTQLSSSLGARGTLLLFLNYYATARILRLATPAFARLAAVEARLEGAYRAGVGRIAREGEEIAFYDGGGRERAILSGAYTRLVRHVNGVYRIRIRYEWIEDYVIKYAWSAAGYGLIAVPLLFTRARRGVGTQTQTGAGGGVEDAVAGRTETYISNRRLLISLADAGGRLMYAYKDLLELAGLTTRIYTLLSTLHNLPSLPPSEAPVDTLTLAHVDVGVPAPTTHDAVQVQGAPLVKDLSFVLKPGEHLMITGSNGVGKTAVARVLAGLWAPHSSPSPSHSTSPTPHTSPTAPTPAPLVQRPPTPAVLVVPQRAYMPTGSLLEQVIYPHSYPQFLASGRTLEDLGAILEGVYLGYLVEREGGWRVRREWRDVLSGGEKQRMGMARVLYHQPKFAVLDECTSAVSSDVEGRMYENLKRTGITLITISLRPSLAKYHTHLLTLAGDGSARWTLTRVGTAEERLGVDREIDLIERKLGEQRVWEERLRELDAMLAVQEAAA